MKLENKIKLGKGAAWVFGAAAVFNAVLAFSYAGKMNSILKTEIYKEYTNTKNVITDLKNISNLHQDLAENTYFAEDKLLKKYNEQRLELDSLTRSRFEDHLSKIEKDPELIMQKENRANNGEKSERSFSRFVILATGTLLSALIYVTSKSKKTTSQ